MASLHVLKGTTRGQNVSLETDVFVLGRSRDCSMAIPLTSVSRQHARILRLDNRYCIEDMRSRNGTKVNGHLIGERTYLKDRDRIQICDFVAVFLDNDSRAPVVPERGPIKIETEIESDTSTTIRAKLPHSNNFVLGIHSAEKLRQILSVSNNLSRILELDQLLPQIAERIFALFKQADRCFVLLREDEGDDLTPAAVRIRRPEDESGVRYSSTIARRCLEQREGFLSDNAPVDVPDSKSVLTYQIRSLMCVPLCASNGDPLGALELVAQEAGKRFTSDDLELLLGAANQVAIALENARRHEELIRIEQVELDLEIAGQVQRSILPEKPPKVPGYEFFDYYHSAFEVGGDYYDFIPLAGQRLAVTLGDVAGKGMPAALLMTKLCSDARYCFLAESDPAAALGRLNELLHRHTTRTDRFVTLAAAVLDPARNHVTLVNAGQLPPLLYRYNSGKFAEAIPYDLGDRPLGLEKARIYNSCELTLQPGDSILLFTDGVTDAVNICNQRFGLYGVHKSVEEAGPCSARSLGARVIQALERHAAGCNQHDDITLVCFGRTAVKA